MSCPGRPTEVGINYTPVVGLLLALVRMKFYNTGIEARLNM